MPFIKLLFRPGINRDTTNYTNEGGWFDGDKIRFRSGMPQKIGGWVKSTPTKFLGTCRQMWNWVTSFGDNFLALGTNLKVYIEVSGVFYNITPFVGQIISPDSDDCITVTNLSNVVTITTTIPHGLVDGQFVFIEGVVGYPNPGDPDIGGIPLSEINTEHVITVVDPSTFTFTTPTTCNLGTAWGLGDWDDGEWGIGAVPSQITGTGGNNIVIDVELRPGNAYSIPGYGWGTSVWNGSFGWGLGSLTPITLAQRDWWFDNFDNDLVMNIRKNYTEAGPIYYWERGSSATNPLPALQTRASLLSSFPGASDVPDEAMQILVSQNDKHLLAFGATPFGGGDFDPMLIRWANQDDPFNWTPSPTNSAGFIRVSRGSRIVRALSTRQEVLVWTESHLYALQFLGTTDVFGLQELADNVSIIGPRACISADNVTYWMGKEKFYAYTGRVETVPCTILNYVFRDINLAQVDQIISGTNEQWHEVWWFYPSGDSNWVNRYVVYNYREKVWYFGNLGRTAWLDSPMRQFPQAAFTALEDQDGNGEGLLYNHEDGNDDDGLPLPAYIQSSDVDLEDGDKLMLSRRIIPDIDFDGSTTNNPEVRFEIRPRNFPGSSFKADQTDSQRVIQTSVNNFTDQVFIRARARQMALKVASENLGVHWELGSPRVDVRPDGKR
jgi:hypothetical protein